jgi:hypothetical protein
MADEQTDGSETPGDPSTAASDADDDESPPADDSFLLGVPGVEAEVLAELARAEASLRDPEEPSDDSDGAVV